MEKIVKDARVDIRIGSDTKQLFKEVLKANRETAQKVLENCIKDYIIANLCVFMKKEEEVSEKGE